MLLEAGAGELSELQAGAAGSAKELDNVTGHQKAARAPETTDSFVSRGSGTRMGLLSLSSRAS